MKKKECRHQASEARQLHRETDEETFSRLAALPRTEYDRRRKVEAGRLGIRPGTLDAEVAARRPQIDGLQGSTVQFPDVEPWGTPVKGADVLNAVSERLSRYVAMPRGAADELALYIAHTHCFEAFDHTPRLNVCSAEKNCGKTTALDVVASLVRRPLRADSLTPAVMFRLVASHKPTLLLDEVDSYRLNEAEELRGLLNAGHRRGGMAYRCEGDSNTVRSFSVHSPAVLAGIGALPGTLHDRCIIIRLERAKPGEVPARFDSRRVEHETELRRKLARWADDNFDRLRECDPQLPETAYNRLADNWRPLFAIAEVAGGDWPQRVRAAFLALTATADLDAQGVGTMLLSDIADLFVAKNTDRLQSSEIAESLAAIEGRPWAEWGKHRRPISPNQLAKQLHRFGISPDTIRIGDETPRGYLLADFAEAFSRYLPGTPIADRNTPTTLGKSPISEVQHPQMMLHPEKAPSQRECCTVAPCTEGEGPNNGVGRDGAMSTPTPIEILKEAAKRGLTLGVKPPHTLTVQPANRCPKDFASVLTQHKPRLLGLLRLPFLIAYSKVLGETIVLAEDENTKTALVEAGAEPFSIYTKDELHILIAHNRAKLFFPTELRKLHEIKRGFNGTVTP